MDSLVEVWRTISLRALTASITAQERPFVITLAQTEDGKYRLATGTDHCSICYGEVKQGPAVSQCKGCNGSFHKKCIILREINCVVEGTDYYCFACKIKKRADENVLEEKDHYQQQIGN